MKFSSALFAAACAAVLAVSCQKADTEEEFVFEALDIVGSNPALQIMDRNVGAKSVEDPGNYYQYGNNTPVAYGADATLNENYDPNWTLDKVKNDWSNPANTPCPKGWRLANADDIKNLEKVLDNNSMMYEFDMCSKAEYEACKAMAASMGLIGTGKFQVGKEGKYLPDNPYFWTSQTNAKTQGMATMFEYNSDPLFGKNNAPSTAAPLRCVK